MTISDFATGHNIAQIGFDNYRRIGSVTFVPHPPKVIESEKLSGTHMLFMCNPHVSIHVFQMQGLNQFWLRSK